MIIDVQSLQGKLESTFANNQAKVEKEALSLYESSSEKAIDYLTNYTNSEVAEGVTQWKKLGEYLLVKYMDGGIKIEEQGQFKRNEHGNSIYPKRPGYSEEQRRKIVEETGDKYKVLF